MHILYRYSILFVLILFIKNTVSQPFNAPCILWDIDDVMSTYGGQALPVFNAKFESQWEDIAQRVVQNHKDGFEERCLRYARKQGATLERYIIDKINGPKSPIIGTVEIIRELHKAGIPQYTGSNMGISVYRDLQRRPGFEFLTMYLNPEQSQHVTYERLRDGIYKPNPRFFADFCDRNQLDPATVIFIDDRYYNVDGARKAGLIGILFTTPMKLQIDLNRILVEQFGISVMSRNAISVYTAM